MDTRKQMAECEYTLRETQAKLNDCKRRTVLQWINIIVMVLLWVTGLLGQIISVFEDIFIYSSEEQTAVSLYMSMEHLGHTTWVELACKGACILSVFLSAKTLFSLAKEESAINAEIFSLQAKLDKLRQQCQNTPTKPNTWQCSCGKIHPLHVSTCVCGGNKHQSKAK